MKLNRNKALAMFASFIILTTAIGIGVWSIGSSSTIIVTPPSLTDSYSYTISANDGTTYLKNGSTGQILYSGTNSTLAEEYAIGNLTVGSGGSILLKEIAHDTGLAFADNIFLTVELEGVLDYWIGGNQIFHVEAGVVVVSGTLEATNIYMDGSLDFNDQMATKMKFWSGTSFPLSPVAGQPYYRTDLKTLYVYDGASWNNAGTGTLDSSASYSYLVFINGTTTYMKNGTTGRIDYSSTNASKVFLFALGNSSFGNTVYVKNGQYSIDTTLTMSQGGVTLEGESHGGVKLILATPNIPLIKLSSLGTFQYLFTLRNLWLQGVNLAGSIGVLVDSASPGNISDITYDKLIIQNFARSLIEIRAYGGKTWNHWIQNCLLEDSVTGYGVYLTNTTGPDMGSIDRVNIYNCHFYNNLHSLYCDSQYVWNVAFTDNTVDRERQDSIYSYCGRQWTIQNNKIYDCGNWTRNTYGGIVLNSTLSGLNASAWIITGNIIENHWEANVMNYSIWLIGNMTHIIVSDNTLLDSEQGQGTGIKIDGLIWVPSIMLSGNEGFYEGFASDTSGYNYLVFTDSSTYFMRNGSTGRVDYQSSNASKLFGFAVGNLTWGGTISVKAGVYNIDSTILLNKIGVKILGETWGINDYGVVFNLTTSGIPMFNITGVSPNHIWFVTIEDVELRGNALANSVGVLIGGETYTSDVTLDRVFLNGFAYGLKISALTQKVWNIWLRDSLIETNTKAGVYFTGTSHYLTNMIDRVTIENCHFALNLNSLYCDTPHVYHVSFVENSVELETQTSINATGGRNWVVSNNRMLDCGSSAVNTYGCIKVNGSNTAVMCWPQGWRISDNTLQNHFTGNMNYSVWLTGLIADFDVHDNNFANTTTTFRQDGLNATSYGNKFHDNTYAVSPSDQIGTASFIVSAVGSTYYATNCTDGSVLVQSTNASQVEQFALGNLTASGGMVWLKEVQHNTSLTMGNKVIVIESYNGTLRSWSNQGKGFLLSRLAADPDTSGWGDAEAPFWWYNSVEDTIKYWNGTGVVVIPSIGGGSASSYTLPYTYTIYKTGSTYYSEKYDGTLYSSTNASKVVDYAVGNITDGSVFLRSGSYNLSTMSSYIQTAGKNLEIVGENWDSTVLIDSRSGDTRTIGATASASPTGNLTIRNIKFDRRETPDETVKYCVYGSWLNVWIEHCRFIGNVTLADSTTLHTRSVTFSGNIATDYTTNVVFINNYVLDFQYGCVPVHCAYSKQTGNYIENAQTWSFGADVSETSNAQFIITDNTLINCAWYDEGISIDAVDPAVSVNTNSLIANNLIYNDASHPLGKGIATIAANGVTVTSNKIVNLGWDANYWGEISVDANSYTSVTNVTISNNDILTYSARAMELRGLCGGTIKSNTIRYGNATSESLGIRMSWSKSITYDAGLIYITDNDIYLSGSNAGNTGFQLAQTAGAGGTVKILMDGNKVTAAKGLTTDIDAVVTVTLGGGNWFNCTTAVTDSGSVATVYAATYSQVYMGGASANLGTDNATIQYVPMPYKGSPSTGTDRQTIVLYTGTIRHVRVYLYAAPGTGAWRNITLYVNAVATALTVNITGTGTTGIDFTNEIAVTAGNRVQWGLGCGNLAAVPVATMVDISVEYEWVEGTS